MSPRAEWTPDRRMVNTSGWAGWSQYFRFQICPRGFGREEQKRPHCDLKTEALRYNLWFHDLYQMGVLQLDRHYT